MLSLDDMTLDEYLEISKEEYFCRKELESFEKKFKEYNECTRSFLCKKFDKYFKKDVYERYRDYSLEELKQKHREIMLYADFLDLADKAASRIWPKEVKADGDKEG